MKKIIFTLCLWLTVSWLWAQQKSDPQIFTGNTALQARPVSGGGQMHIQVGSPIGYSDMIGPNNVHFSIRFPWDVAYFPQTFYEETFQVSKGYYGDKIQLDWTIHNNSSFITRIRIYRRVFSESNLNDQDNFVAIASLSADTYTYADQNTQGGLLYEYKVEAEGIFDIDTRYTTYITGIGYRNPTGVVTGSVSFNGGSPVKDVVIRADPQGGEQSFGASLSFDGTDSLIMPLTRKVLEDKITVQMWVKLDEGQSASLFKLRGGPGEGVEASVTTTPNSLEVAVTHAGGLMKSFAISDYYPTGNVNGKGDDLFSAFSSEVTPQSDFSGNFAHLTVILANGSEPVLYLNGRKIDDAYAAALPDGALLKPEHITTSGSGAYAGYLVGEIIFGEDLSGSIDELRVWGKVLNEKEIRTDFKRYLGGSEPALVSYMRCDEAAGEYAYDISKVGVEFNRNHGRIFNANWSTDKPASSQLGILGVTDSLGNYIISAIPYGGSGASYTITPMLGVHQFQPGQQLIFVGQGSEVTNQVNFTDISAFQFLGKVYYTTDGVFDGEVTDNVTFVTDAGYNQYEAIIGGVEQMISKGNYFYDSASLTLYETPTVFAPGANVYVDGNIALGKDKRPVLTDEKGEFSIEVPIGRHYIEVRKKNHVFTHGGRFPAARNDGNDLFDFFEHQETAVTFLDSTRVSLVGRVVGGLPEAGKPIGFGYAGSLKETYDAETDSAKTVDISSVNNIGTATITLTYLPPGGTPGVGELTYTFSTHEETGEYKVKVLPLSYTIKQLNGIGINSNDTIQLLTANETVNLSDVRDTLTSEYVNASGETVHSDSYHFVKNFTYRSVPVLNVIAQASDTEVIVPIVDEHGNEIETSISTEGFDFPVYTQGLYYGLEFQTFEEYINYDGGQGHEVTDEVPIVDGEFNITNNLALEGSEKITVNPSDPSISQYVFRAGLPSISPPFTRTINIQYRVGGKDYEARNYAGEGIILGGQSDGSQTFVTEAPDMPDIILRDPPGSHSYASIEKGSVISLKQEGSFGLKQTGEIKTAFKFGVTFKAGGGMVGPVIESESTNNLTLGVSMAVESAHGGNITKTYSFNETISTSDDPGFVGSDGDLYIGNSRNYFYGSFDNIQVSKDQPVAESISLNNVHGESVNISKQKGFYFAEEPSNTFFIYSQRYILETLIPELEGIIAGLDAGTVDPTDAGVQTRSHYVEQVRQWKEVIQDNERAKYRSLYDRVNLKAEIEANIQDELDSLDNYLRKIKGWSIAGIVGIVTAPAGIQGLIAASKSINDKQAALNAQLQKLHEHFSKNVSFDAGVGAYTNSNVITIADERTRSVNLDLDASVEAALGFKLNGFGLIVHTSNTLNKTINTALTEKADTTTTITYTLKDSDPSNFLSVDVVNTFDGNGPIFSTVGGRTSCPYEGVDTTIFYNHEAHNLAGDTTPKPIFDGGEQISYATQKVEVPIISVEVASVVDVPEERAAEFKLILENNSVAGADANFRLSVDNTTNPHNALINIEQNGTVVFVPYGEKVQYALTLRKSISDVYDYSNIDIILASLCDGGSVNDKVTISAVFRPSCTAVEIERPLDNWVFNAGDAFNIDNSTNPLSVGMFGYNRAFASFENFTLQYRRSTSSSWTRLRTYYNTQDLLDEAIAQGEDQGVIISANAVSYPWDIGALGLADGEYELRAVSQCSNGTEFISKVARGTVDLHVPVLFGTPSPTNGILGAGEDLRLQFNENILHSPALSKIQIQGETNQQEIDHNVSIHFEGAANTAIIEKPNILPGDFSMEFWLRNQTVGHGVLFEQTDALRLTVSNNTMEWTLGAETLLVFIDGDADFHHYTLTYNQGNKTMRIYRDDQELGLLNDAAGVPQRSDSPLVIGGNAFVGNLHDLRMWSKPFTLAEAYAAQFNELTGSERDLMGYWPMNEGNGPLAHDLARFKHASLGGDWDIKPRGAAYAFEAGQYLVLDDVDFVQVSDLMDVTLSFWMKTDQLQKATLFSNGRGNGEDPFQSNGKTNKWAVTLEAGILYLNTEGIAYKLSTTDLADNTWHHVAIVLRRTGSLRAYIDAKLESSSPSGNIGGISGSKFWVGARGFVNSVLEETVDEVFTGKIDELRLWNMARPTEQIDRDRFHEVDFNSIGLLMYARMNPPDPLTGNGPRYYHVAANETVLPSNALMNIGTVAYTQDAPPIKQVRPYLTFRVSHVINGDEMILTPLVSDWSVLEEQIIDITVDRMFDIYGNRQSSPITWSAYVRRNEVAWFTDEGGESLDIVKQVYDPYAFDITILNKGGKEQPWSVQNIPAWLSAENTSGTLDPNSQQIIRFNIDPNLSIGQYSADLFLDTDFNFDEKIFVDLRVLGEEPAWAVDPTGFENSMNIIGKVSINGIFPQDPNTKVAAFAGEEVRGVARLEYDKDYDEYFLYLNVLSNALSGEDITFRIWDGSIGKIFHATIDGASSLPFIANEVIGFKAMPALFESTSFTQQELLLNKGWTWVSLHVEDPDLGDIDALTAHLQLSDDDLIKSQTEFEVYFGPRGWTGSLSKGGGGLTISSMYKLKFGISNNLVLGGNEVDISAWSANIMAGWNWLAYPLGTNVSLNDALASFDATDGDVIKNQKAFAIYDSRTGWTGPLTYMLAGEGYMLKSGRAQRLTYPEVLKSNSSGRLKQDSYLRIADWPLYEYNMSIVAEIASDEMYDTVLVVDSQGTLRGRAAIVKSDGRQLSYITVFGNGAEEDHMQFYVANDFGRRPADESLIFKPDLILGTVKEPFALNLHENSFTVYPNAFTKTIHMSFNTTYAQETEINLIDVTGHIVFGKSRRLEKGPNEFVLEPDVQEGLYILSVVLDGRRMTWKVIKK